MSQCPMYPCHPSLDQKGPCPGPPVSARQFLPCQRCRYGSMHQSPNGRTSTKLVTWWQWALRTRQPGQTTKAQTCSGYC
eukprot:scaffold228808_cov20-Prasinocladus_malaysianus.AAC.1